MESLPSDSHLTGYSYLSYLSNLSQKPGLSSVSYPASDSRFSSCHDLSRARIS